MDDDESALVRSAAKARGIKPAHFMREAVLAASRAAVSTPSPSATASSASKRQADPGDPEATVRKKLFLTPSESTLLEKEAQAAKLLQRDYLRLAVVAAMTQAPPPRRKAVVSKNDLAHEISMIAFQLKKIGNNLNQMAKQANTGLVPITEREIYYFLSLHQRVLTMSSAALEKVLA
ncbi:MobC family plasmid mobilization relaxosome protein [Hyphomicrobium sp.]|uniref:MobC family plasmid mobilization relaxosome protein n=1 Tax=Hyphomicrobium sp. TaxID=82 RepID=UPI002E2FCAF7|nr:MobC family plasmid mobilization relaxosome protein [Hyphomicrobium sp.]HEX2842158.1 MobC family plasmid mobilization relaxosome protein [Hyphomicrobium sp.]